MEMLVDKIIIERHPSKIDTDGRRHYISAPSHTKILSKRLSSSRQCTKLGSRSSPESEQSNWRRTHASTRTLACPCRRLLDRPTLQESTDVV
jgi:hypothetical protein